MESCSRRNSTQLPLQSVGIYKRCKRGCAKFRGGACRRRGSHLGKGRRTPFLRKAEQSGRNWSAGHLRRPTSNRLFQCTLPAFNAPVSQTTRLAAECSTVRPATPPLPFHRSHKGEPGCCAKSFVYGENK